MRRFLTSKPHKWSRRFSSSTAIPSPSPYIYNEEVQRSFQGHGGPRNSMWKGRWTDIVNEILCNEGVLLLSCRHCGLGIDHYFTWYVVALFILFIGPQHDTFLNVERMNGPTMVLIMCLYRNALPSKCGDGPGSGTHRSGTGCNTCHNSYLGWANPRGIDGSRAGKVRHG